MFDVATQAHTLGAGVVRSAFSSVNGLKATIDNLSASSRDRAKDGVPLPGVFPTAFSSFSFENATRGGTIGVTGSTFFNGACLLPGAANFVVLSGELYIPKTSASASFVLIVTVGSPYTLLLRIPIVRVVRAPSSLKSTGASMD